MKIAFEVSDLVYYYASGQTPTGIQRVQQEFAWELIARRSDDRLGGFVLYDGRLQKWKHVPAGWLSELISAAREKHTGEEWASIYKSFRAGLAASPVYQFDTREWLVNLGASWALSGYFVQARQLRRRGVRIAIFVHDCIPVRHPSYFDQTHVVEFTYWLANVRATADLVICNSQATCRDYMELLNAGDNVRVCNINGSWFRSDADTGAGDAATEKLAELGIFDDRFILCVGTVEPRKNHLALVNVWDKLRQTHPRSVPKLLCIGRVGWKSEAVTSHAKALGLLDNLIVFGGAVSDDVLEHLYKRCLMTVYVSYYEGWGLPISESLHAGKPCIAGSNSSLVEAGAGLATHVDERAETSIHDAIAHFLDQPQSLAAIGKRICESYPARTWTAVTDEVLELIDSADTLECPDTGLPELELNTVYRFGRPKVLKSFDPFTAGEVLCQGQTWHQPEPWGNWTSKEIAELGFNVRKNGSLPTLFMEVMPPPGGADISLSLNSMHVLSLPKLGGGKVIRLELEEVFRDIPTDSDVPVILRVVSSRVQKMSEIAGSNDERQLGPGVRFLAAFDKSSVMERLEFLERLFTREI